jgi:hypothetical protein
MELFIFPLPGVNPLKLNSEFLSSGLQLSQITRADLQYWSLQSGKIESEASKGLTSALTRQLQICTVG